MPHPHCHHYLSSAISHVFKRSMTKKRAPNYDIKPNSPAHPSLSPSSKTQDVRSLGSKESPSGNSVNDRIQRLRISQGASASLQGSQTGRLPSQALGSGAGPSLPPSLRSILQLPDAPPPRPRPGLRVTGRLRGPAGPAPPVSWTRAREQVAGKKPKTRRISLGGAGAKIEQLPGIFSPTHGSLIHTVLKALALNWDWHVQYDQYYLATIPVRYKEALLSCIARYSPTGTDKAGLVTLFLNETDLEDATGVDGLTHLDLSTSIGHRLKLKQLKDLLSGKKTIPGPDEISDVLPESWDTPDLPSAPSGLPRFHSLTHLSLSHPSNGVTWKGLLDLAPELATITHLSLAYWSTPTMSPNSATAYRETPQGNVNFGASNFYSGYDNDWTEAASILRRLSKSTYCLKWLDLTGCFPWVQALKYGMIDWCGTWRALETIKIGQGYIPDCFQDNAEETAWPDIYWNRAFPLNHEMSSSSTASHQKRHLVEWVHAEGITMGVEDSVNATITESIKASSIPETQEPETARPEGEALDGWANIPSTAISARRSRSQRISFERGWDAWWIRDAIRQMSKAEARVVRP